MCCWFFWQLMVQSVCASFWHPCINLNNKNPKISKLENTVCFQFSNLNGMCWGVFRSLAISFLWVWGRVCVWGGSDEDVADRSEGWSHLAMMKISRDWGKMEAQVVSGLPLPFWSGIEARWGREGHMYDISDAMKCSQSQQSPMHPPHYPRLVSGPSGAEAQKHRPSSQYFPQKKGETARW